MKIGIVGGGTPQWPLPSEQRRVALILLPALALAIITGCQGIGPATVARDRFDYSSSISESWKRQTLLNIVKMRYLDPPIFVDVGQIVAGYSFETGVSAGGQISSERAIQGNSLLLGGSAKFIDRPTVTYTPLTGNKFLKGLMTPLLPEAVFFTIQSGWPADAVLFTAVAAINGLNGMSVDGRALVVSLARPREDRPASGAHSPTGYRASNRLDVGYGTGGFGGGRY